MGILHDMLDKIHAAHDQALQLADPKQAAASAHRGFFEATADLVHSLEARIVEIEHALFGTKELEPPVPSPETTPVAATSAPIPAEPGLKAEPAPNLTPGA